MIRNGKYNLNLYNFFFVFSILFVFFPSNIVIITIGSRSVDNAPLTDLQSETRPTVHLSFYYTVIFLDEIDSCRVH